jgi:hypothetical protein
MATNRGAENGSSWGPRRGVVRPKTYPVLLLVSTGPMPQVNPLPAASSSPGGENSPTASASPQ